MDLFRAQDAAIRAAVKAGAQTTDGYVNAISRLGLNQDNAISGGTYQFDLITRNRILLEMAYRGSWIVGQVVDCVAEDMTRAGVTFTTSEGEQDLAEFNALYTRLSIWDSISDGIKWGRLYGGGLGVMQIEGQDLRTPLDSSTVGRGQFQGIAVFDRWMLNPLMSPIISSGPDIGLPMYYQIVSSLESYDPGNKTAQQLSDLTGSDSVVHHSRVFRFGGIKLPFFQAITEQMWDESVLERLWDRLIAFDNATLATASLIDHANLRTVRIESLREIIAAGGEAMAGLQGHFEMMRLAQTNMGLTLLDKNDEFASTSYSFAGIPETLLQFGQQLSGASQIPLVRLFGQSPAGLNATGDGEIRMYYDGINAKQERVLRKPFKSLAQVMWRSRFGKPAPSDLEFTFNPLWQMSDKEKSEIARTNTESVVVALDSGLLTRPAAMKELRGLTKTTGLFTNITDEDIAEAELEPPPLPDMPDTTNVVPTETDTTNVVSEQVREPVQVERTKTGDSKPRRRWSWLRRF